MSRDGTRHALSPAPRKPNTAATPFPAPTTDDGVSSVTFTMVTDHEVN